MLENQAAYIAFQFILFTSDVVPNWKLYFYEQVIQQSHWKCTRLFKLNKVEKFEYSQIPAEIGLEKK